MRDIFEIFIPALLISSFLVGGGAWFANWLDSPDEKLVRIEKLEKKVKKLEKRIKENYE